MEVARQDHLLSQVAIAPETNHHDKKSQRKKSSGIIREQFETDEDCQRNHGQASE